MDRASSVAFARDWLVVTVLAGGLVALAGRIDTVVLQLPAYLLIVGFDALQALVGAWTGFEVVQFGAYLVGLGALGAAIGHLGRTRRSGSDVAGWRFGIAGLAAIVGVIALVLAASVVVGSDQPGPAAIAGGAGVGAFLLAAWLGGLFDSRGGTVPLERK